MNYVYLLKSPEHGVIYIGFTTDLKQRFAEHQQLRRHKGWRLIYYEAYLDEGDARERERMLKHYGSSLGRLKHRLKRSLELSRI